MSIKETIIKLQTITGDDPKQLPLVLKDLGKAYKYLQLAQGALDTSIIGKKAFAGTELESLVTTFTQLFKGTDPLAPLVPGFPAFPAFAQVPSIVQNKLKLQAIQMMLNLKRDAINAAFMDDIIDFRKDEDKPTEVVKKIRRKSKAIAGLGKEKKD